MRGLVLLVGALVACGPGNEDPTIPSDGAVGSSESDGRGDVNSVDPGHAGDGGLPTDVDASPAVDGSAVDTHGIVSPNVDGSTGADGSIGTMADGPTPTPIQPNDEGCIVFRDAPNFGGPRQVQTNEEGLWVFGGRNGDKEVWVSRNEVWQKDAYASGLEGPLFVDGSTVVMTDRKAGPSRFLHLRIDGRWVRSELDTPFDVSLLGVYGSTTLVVGGGTSSLLVIGNDRKLQRFNKSTLTWDFVTTLPSFVTWPQKGPGYNSRSVAEVGDVIYVGYSTGIAMYTAGTWQDLQLKDLMFHHVAAGPNGTIYAWTPRDLLKLEGDKTKAIPAVPGKCGYNTDVNSFYPRPFEAFAFGALLYCEDRLYRLEGETWKELKQPPFMPRDGGYRFYGLSHPGKVTFIQPMAALIPEVFSLVNNEWERSANRHFYAEQNAMPQGRVYGGSIDELVLVSFGSVYKLRNGTWQTSGTVTKAKDPFDFKESWMHPVHPHDVFTSATTRSHYSNIPYNYYLSRTDQTTWTTTTLHIAGVGDVPGGYEVTQVLMSGRSDDDVYVIENTTYRGVGKIWHWDGGKWEFVADNNVGGNCGSPYTMSVTHSGLLGFRGYGPRVVGGYGEDAKRTAFLCFGRIENKKIVITSTSNDLLGLWGVLDKAAPVPLFVTSGKVYTERGWQPVSSPIEGQIVGGSSVSRFVVERFDPLRRHLLVENGVVTKSSSNANPGGVLWTDGNWILTRDSGEDEYQPRFALAKLCPFR